jgi:putative hydrolase of the HAD superfamily
VIRAVISDFGGVLTTPLTESFRAFADQSGIELAAMGDAFAALAERDGAHPLHELECGRMSEETFVARLQRALSDVSGRKVALESFADVLWAGLLPNEPMIALMASLRAEGYRMALLTNNVREWEARWRAMAPVDDIFELVIDSAFVGMRKPEPAIYELAVARLGVPADECLFVDDREDNCAGARAAGMSVVVYRDVEQAVAEIRGTLEGGGDDGLR